MLYAAYDAIAGTRERPPEWLQGGSRGLRVLSLLEIALFMLVMAYAVLVRQSKLDFLMIPLMGAGILISFLMSDSRAGMAGSPIWNYLGRLSYPIYLNQIAVMITVQKYLNAAGEWTQLCFFVAALILLSTGTLELCDGALRLYAAVSHKSALAKKG